MIRATIALWIYLFFCAFSATVQGGWTQKWIGSPEADQSFAQVLAIDNVDDDSQLEIVIGNQPGHYITEIYVLDGLTGEIEWNSGAYFRIHVMASEQGQRFDMVRDIDDDQKAEIVFIVQESLDGPYQVYVWEHESDSPVDENNTGNTSHTSPKLFEIHPNPFSPTTKLAYSVYEPGRIKIEVYNAQGQKVRDLLDDEKEVGHHHVIWDAKSDQGEPVPAGLYIYQIKMGDQVSQRKIMILR